jgi:hypothetical protein
MITRKPNPLYIMKYSLGTVSVQYVMKIILPIFLPLRDIKRTVVYSTRILTIYSPVIYTGPCIMFWRRGYTLRGEVGGGWALKFPSFWGPVKW